MHGSCSNTFKLLSTADLTTLNQTVLSQSDLLQHPLNQGFYSASSSTNLPQPLSPTINPFVVTSIADTIDPTDGVITLREAINTANSTAGADTISFNLGAGSHTITLTNGQLNILDDLTIQGLGAANLTISGRSVSRVFQVGSTSAVTLEGIRIADGNATGFSGDSFGGGIFNTGNLTVTDSILQFNHSIGGGAIYNRGTMRVINTTLQNNSANAGGAIQNDGVMEVISSTIKTNFVYGGLGGGIRDAGQLTITGSAIVNNMAALGGGLYSGYSITSAVLPVISPILKNSTIAGNTPSWADAPRPDIVGGINSDGGNLIGFINGKVNNTSRISDRIGTASNPLQPMFNLTVDTLVDEMDNNFSAGDLSLREALSLLSPGGTINFAKNLRGTITLNLGELLLEKNVTMNGLGANNITISGNQQSRVMNIASYVAANLEGLTISGGLSQTNGGGIWMNRGSEVTLKNMMVNHNTVSNGKAGGGIWNDRGNLTVINSTLTGNSASFGSAILNGNSTFPSDRSSTTNLINSTIAENQALMAGGIVNWLGSLTLTSSTVSTNQGLGVLAYDTTTVHSTIIAGNSSSLYSPNSDVSGYFISKGYNLVGDGTGSTGFDQFGDQVGTSQQPIDPKLGPLEDDNGPLYTMIPLWGSHAINAGDPALWVESDQNGMSRQQAGRPDTGATEWVNRVATAVNDTVTFRGQSTTFNPLSNDYDLDGHSFRIVDYSNPRIGTLTRNADGTLTYSIGNPQSLSPQTDSFTYQITDGLGDTNTARATIYWLP